MKQYQSNFPLILFRLIVPLSIFFHPFWGAVASLIADDLDVVILDLFRMKKFKNYIRMDKTLDIYYLLIEWITVIIVFQNPFKIIASILFLYRLIGTVLFLFTGKRIILFYFPNIFEYFYLTYVFFLYIVHISLSLDQLIVVLLLLLPFKLLQEYLLHIKQVKPWEYFKHVLSGKQNT